MKDEGFAGLPEHLQPSNVPAPKAMTPPVPAAQIHESALYLRGLTGFLLVHSMSSQGLLDAAYLLDQFAARVAQEAQTCATCRFAGEVFETKRICDQLTDVNSGDEMLVPLTVNGQPFGCRGHRAKEPA